MANKSNLPSPFRYPLYLYMANFSTKISVIVFYNFKYTIQPLGLLTIHCIHSCVLCHTYYYFDVFSLERKKILLTCAELRVIHTT